MAEGPGEGEVYAVGGAIILQWVEIQHSLRGREDKVERVSETNTVIDLEESGLSDSYLVVPFLLRISR